MERDGVYDGVSPARLGHGAMAMMSMGMKCRRRPIRPPSLGVPGGAAVSSLPHLGFGGARIRRQAQAVMSVCHFTARSLQALLGPRMRDLEADAGRAR